MSDLVEYCNYYTFICLRADTLEAGLCPGEALAWKSVACVWVLAKLEIRRELHDVPSMRF